MFKLCVMLLCIHSSKIISHLLPNFSEFVMFYCSALSRTSSGSSMDSVNTPLKVLEKDASTGEYIVCMSPQDFDRISNQNHINPNDTRYT